MPVRSALLPPSRAAAPSLVLLVLVVAALLPAGSRAQSPLVLLNSWGTPGPGEGQLDSPLRFDATDPITRVLAGALFVIDGPAGAHRLQRFDGNGNYVRGYAASLIDPVAVTVIESNLVVPTNGTIAVLDAGASEIRILDAETGDLLDQWSVPAITDGDIDFDPWSRSLWVCFTDLHFVQEYSLSGTPLRSIGVSGMPGSGVGRFDGPRSVEARGLFVYIADTANDRAVEVSWTGNGALIWVWAEGGGSGSAPGQFDQPWAITSDCEGRVLVADRGNGRIQRLVRQATGPGSSTFELVFDAQWFDDGSTFSDLIDLVNPTGPPSGVTRLPQVALEHPKLGDTGPGVSGLFALDRSTAVLRHFEDFCCIAYDWGFFEVVASTAGGTILITPAGTGPTLGELGATVEIEVRDACGKVVVGFPYQDIFLHGAGIGEISLCLRGSVADANTDAMGRTTISGAIAGGGWTEAGLRVYLSGIPFGEVLPINVVSPDMNRDLVVNLADVGTFAADFSSGVLSFRADFDRDGQLTLADLGLLAAHFGESCP